MVDGFLLSEGRKLDLALREPAWSREDGFPWACAQADANPKAGLVRSQSAEWDVSNPKAQEC